jgi:hypothetical protein
MKETYLQLIGKKHCVRLYRKAPIWQCLGQGETATVFVLIRARSSDTQ